mmetsp:Transcript_29482/g.78543  ORF Transcript_29482/g.78543 Transcript_29482/m.78543 type:complete len:120 (+) Transcript_29482:1545-1904(+)
MQCEFALGSVVATCVCVAIWAARCFVLVLRACLTIFGRGGVLRTLPRQAHQNVANSPKTHEQQSCLFAFDAHTQIVINQRCSFGATLLHLARPLPGTVCPSGKVRAKSRSSSAEVEKQI